MRLNLFSAVVLALIMNLLPGWNRVGQDEKQTDRPASK